MITKSDTSSLKLARQENAQAIAQLINRWLEPRGITATATREEHCFEISFEVESPPNPKVLMALVGKVLRYLGMVPVKTLKISVYLKPEHRPLWHHEIDLMPRKSAQELAGVSVIPGSLPLSWVDTLAGKVYMSLPIVLALLAFFTPWVDPKSASVPSLSPPPATESLPPTPVPLPVSVSTPTPEPIPINPDFYQAVNTAINASKLAQNARSPAQWQEVATQWQAAVSFMQAVPTSAPQYSLAQQKVQEYQRKLKYAQAKAAAKPALPKRRRR